MFSSNEKHENPFNLANVVTPISKNNFVIISLSFNALLNADKKLFENLHIVKNPFQRSYILIFFPDIATYKKYK